MAGKFFLIGATIELLAGLMLITVYDNSLGYLGLTAGIVMALASHFVEDIK